MKFKLEDFLIYQNILKKIDIYDQIEMNLDNIAQYVEIKLFNLMEEE